MDYMAIVMEEKARIRDKMPAILNVASGTRVRSVADSDMSSGSDDAEMRFRFSVV